MRQGEVGATGGGGWGRGGGCKRGRWVQEGEVGARGGGGCDRGRWGGGRDREVGGPGEVGEAQ